jgi:ectoine hydroxylase-related dioxygenase (phytanoyl-CoA dioxygenase family)
MTATETPRSAVGSTSPGWFSAEDCRLADFRAVVEQATDLADYPSADRVEQNALVYGPGLADRAGSPGARRQLQAELARALMDGPGIVVFAGAFGDVEVVDRASAAFERMIAEQKAAGGAAGDHFAPPGANDRVWGALDKLAVREPSVFADYYANDVIALVSEAWLGANYQVTSQVNVVNPGGAAQIAHRDYHLGFMDAAAAGRYPAHVHRLSPVLTLQGAVAHCDMPLETGPTMYLPHSQRYRPGYLAFHRPEFTDYFDANHTQLPLHTGDAVFFNPALFHAAGTNRTGDVRRMANLLQVSSAFGRAMEAVDRTAMCRALYPTLLAMAGDDAAGPVVTASGPVVTGPVVTASASGPPSGTAPGAALRNVIAASAEGYPFPTNLDRDQPVDGPAPQSQAELLHQALAESWDQARFDAALTAQQQRRRSPWRST